jgi:hypothetical protein
MNVARERHVMWACSSAYQHGMLAKMAGSCLLLLLRVLCSCHKQPHGLIDAEAFEPPQTIRDNAVF